jgi:hypothetical protein
MTPEQAILGLRGPCKTSQLFASHDDVAIVRKSLRLPSAMSSLFRSEVIEGRQQAWLGSIQLVRPVPLIVLTVLVVVTAILVAGFLFEGRYTRKAHITGYLVPDRGVLRLVPPQAGACGHDCAHRPPERRRRVGLVRVARRRVPPQIGKRGRSPQETRRG